MKLRRVQLQNFRGFADLTLDLNEAPGGFTLLVGANGAGKSSVLDGVAVALGAWLLSLRGGRTRHITREEMRLVKIEHDGVPSLEEAGTTAVNAEGVIDGETLHWQRELRSRTGHTITSAQRLQDIAKAKRERIVANEVIDLPVIAYYGTGRLWVQKREREDRLKELGSILQGYEACLEPASDHKLLEAWMAWREEVRLQEIGRALEERLPIEEVRSPLLDAVAEAARSCVEGATRFYYSVNHKELRLDMKDGRTIPFSLLSDGYRNLLAVAADIAWRAARLNPHYGADAARRATGVVLIDEIDLHLHPAWQRTVIGDLRRAFPNLQFLASTHSPQVIASARPHWIRVLTGTIGPRPDRFTDLIPGLAGPAIHTYGRDTNSLLREVFGVGERPEEAFQRIAEVESLLASNDLAAARERIQRLERDWGSEDAMVRGLRWELHDAEVNNAQGPQRS